MCVWLSENLQCLICVCLGDSLHGAIVNFNTTIKVFPEFHNGAFGLDIKRSQFYSIEGPYSCLKGNIYDKSV